MPTGNLNKSGFTPVAVGSLNKKVLSVLPKGLCELDIQVV